MHLISGEPITGSNNEFWPIMHGTQQVGVVASAVYLPRLDANIDLVIDAAVRVVGTVKSQLYATVEHGSATTKPKSNENID